MSDIFGQCSHHRHRFEWRVVLLMKSSVNKSHTIFTFSFRSFQELISYYNCSPQANLFCQLMECLFFLSRSLSFDCFSTSWTRNSSEVLWQLFKFSCYETWFPSRKTQRQWMLGTIWTLDLSLPLQVPRISIISALQAFSFYCALKFPLHVCPFIFFFHDKRICVDFLISTRIKPGAFCYALHLNTCLSVIHRASLCCCCN